MSNYQVLLRVSEKLRDTLWSAFQQENSTIITNAQQIAFTNPKETARNSSQRLSLWLYRVTEDEFLKNQPMERVNVQRTNGRDSDAERVDRTAPLALNLFYLLTPMASLSNPSEVESDLLVLGRALQALYDNAIIPLHTPSETIVEELRVILCRLSLDELTKVWEALQEPYRLSVCYQVRVTRIDSTRQRGARRVTDRQGQFGDLPVSEE
ncbi:MAG TPA: DUF4255 domain-containing protein [Herpetosiphonaceae bacterium]